jgi:hypothetical protein
MTKLSGTVTVHGDVSASSTVVEIHNADGDIVDQVQADTDGRFTFHLSPGVWSLRAWDNAGHRARGRVTLSDEGDRIVALDLQVSEEERR